MGNISLEGDGWHRLNNAHDGNPKAWINDRLVFSLDGKEIEAKVIRVDIHDEHLPESPWYSYKVVDDGGEKYLVPEKTVIRFVNSEQHPPVDSSTAQY